MNNKHIWLGLTLLITACSTEQHGHRNVNPAPQQEATALRQSTIPQQKFINPLTIPPKMVSDGVQNGITHFTVIMQQTQQKLGWRNASGAEVPTTLWTYNNSFPGPTFDVPAGKPIMVTYQNQLPEKPLVTQSLPNGQINTTGGVPHLHGGFIPSESDGNPMQPIPLQGSVNDFYPNNQPATTLWYHDHTMGSTRTNVYSGLAGVYLIRDSQESLLRLPSGRYEFPLVIQDRTFTESGQLYYPANWSRFAGDTILVNGKIWPYVTVEPRKYRLRLLNGSNQRFYRLMFKAQDPTTSGNVPMYVIGSDGGLLTKPVPVKNLLLAPGERYDLIVDFKNLRGNFIFSNDAVFPYPSGIAPTEDTSQIMQFRVNPTLRFADSDLNNTLPSQLETVTPASVTRYQNIIEQADLLGFTNPNQLALAGPIPYNFKIRRLTLERRGSPLALTLNEMGYMDTATETPHINTNEVWEFINLTDETHPMHLHLVQFRILGRQPYDVTFYQQNKQLKFTGPNVPPAPEEADWKDVVNASPGMVTRIAMRFSGYTGEYVWHCHILEHEDNDMMRPLVVVP